ncbi:baeRF3 domain-containing protein [Nucisporomicrobium flavum]|uniref:baeRF3 domain-containing protein n=1 Tax=Nucisporomicrobium flavum TaxID=2785915 RepID=UPI0018F3121F|nr:hypothetical protein [Nucisporomicrobium flavum]
MTPPATAPSAPTATVPTAAQITALQQVREYPAVSVLLSTTPAAQLTRADALRLDSLTTQAVDRVRAELQPQAAAPAVRRLHDLVAQARRGPTTYALALYASASTGALIRLPIAVRERAVIDPTFATRDLVRALHRTPRHLVLALNSGNARLFDAVGETLVPALGATFPLTAIPRPEGRSRGRGDRPARGSDHDDLEFYRHVDAALGTYLRLHPAPLVLVGSDRAIATFRRISTNCARLAGTVTANLTHAHRGLLSTRIRSVLEDYLHRRQQEALALIDQRTSAGRVASGMPAAWLTARTHHPEMLAVDETLFYPARLSDDGDTLTSADDPESPDVIDDAVDELIELVLTRGGWIAFTDPGSLDHHDGVALTTRRELAAGITTGWVSRPA